MNRSKAEKELSDFNKMPKSPAAKNFHNAVYAYADALKSGARASQIGRLAEEVQRHFGAIQAERAYGDATPGAKGTGK